MTWWAMRSIPLRMMALEKDNKTYDPKTKEMILRTVRNVRTPSPPSNTYKHMFYKGVLGK